MKKIILFILLLSNILYAHPFDSGNGIITDPYIVTTPVQFDSIRSYTDATHQTFFKLGSDINMSGYSWTPIPYFLGQLDGDYHTINKLTYTDSLITTGTNHYGGFAKILDYSNAGYAVYGDINFAIGNIIFDSLTIDIKINDLYGIRNIGGLAGILDNMSTPPNGKLNAMLYRVLADNLSISIDIIEGRAWHDVGGLIGDGTIGSNVFTCYQVGVRGIDVSYIRNGGIYSSDYHRFGGIVGETSNISSTVNYFASFDQCFVNEARYDIEHNADRYMNVGGIVGHFGECVTFTGNEPIYNINNSYFRGSVHSSGTVVQTRITLGGLVGNFYERTTSTTDSSEEYRFRHSYTIADTLSNGARASSFSGYFASGTSQDSIKGYNCYYWDGTFADNITTPPFPSATSANVFYGDTSTIYAISSLGDFADTNTFTDWDWDSVWVIKDGLPELQWVGAFGSIDLFNPSGSYTELYRIGDNVTIEWITSELDDSAYIYIDDILVDSSGSPYYWTSILSDTLESKIVIISKPDLLDSNMFYVYDSVYSFIDILGVTNNQLTFESSGMDTIMYYYSLDSISWIYIGEEHVTELGFLDTTTFTMASYTGYGMGLDTVYIEVREVGVVELYNVGIAHQDTLYYGRSNTFCNYWKLAGSGTARQIIDASCGWVSGYQVTYRVYQHPTFITGSWNQVYTDVIGSDTHYGDKCCPPGTYYNPYCWAFFCLAPNTWTNLSTGDSIFYAGRYYWAKITDSDSIMVYDALNDTTYLFFDRNDLPNNYQPFQYFAITTDPYLGTTYMTFTISSGKAMSIALNVNDNLPYDDTKALAKDAILLTNLNIFNIRDYFRGYYPRMLR